MTRPAFVPRRARPRAPAARPLRFARLAPLAALALLAAACATAPRAPQGPRLPSDPLERELFERVNRDRAAHGLPAFAWDEPLAAVARGHSRDMAAHDFVSHDSPRTGGMQDRLRAAGYLFRAARENLALHESVQAAEDGLLQSPGHRANLLARDVTHLGLGIVRGGPGGRGLYVTQLFSRPWEKADPADLREAVLAAVHRARARSGRPALEPDAELSRAAGRALSRLRATPQGPALQRLSQELLQAVDPDGARGFRGVAVLAAELLDAEDLKVPAEVAEGAVALGLAAADARDAEGRPVVRLLLVFAVGR